MTNFGKDRIVSKNKESTQFMIDRETCYCSPLFQLTNWIVPAKTRVDALATGTPFPTPRGVKRRKVPTCKEIDGPIPCRIDANLLGHTETYPKG